MRNQQYPINQEYLNQLKMLMKSENASQYIQQIASTNPLFKQILDMAPQGNLQSIYENLARARGVDPDWLIKQLIN